MEEKPVTAVPVKSKRRWYQYRLRTTLIGGAIVAVLAALIIPGLNSYPHGGSGSPRKSPAANRQ
jgi:hypothetical protein